MTAGDTITWFKKNRRPDTKWRAGLKPEKEQQVLAAWHASGK